MDEESRREAPSIQHMTKARSRSDQVRKAPSTNKQRPRSAFVSEFLSRSDRDRRVRSNNVAK